MTNKQTLFLLYFLTLLVFLVAKFSTGLPAAKAGILILSASKFLLVAFFFMEMRKAHSLWKILLFVYIFLFVLLAMLRI